MSRDCSSSLLAGISIATIGVVLISAEATPSGGTRRRSACFAVVVADSSAHVARVTMPVWTTPLAITSIAATVTTPGLESPAKSSSTVAMRSRPAAIERHEQREDGIDPARGHRDEGREDDGGRHVDHRAVHPFN